MTVYGSPYKIGLIYVGTKFTQSWLVRSEIAKSAWISSWGFFCKHLRFVAYVNIAPHQSFQVIIQCGTRYVDFAIFKEIRSVRSFRFFPVLIQLLNWFRIRLHKMRRLGIDKVSIASRQISLRTVRGTLVSRFYGRMSHSSVLLGRQILRSTPLLYRLLNFCKQQTQFNKDT